MFLQFDSSDVRNLLLRVAIRLPCLAECDIAEYRLFLPSRIASFARSRSLLAETPSPRVPSPRFTVLRAGRVAHAILASEARLALGTHLRQESLYGAVAVVAN